MLRASLGHLNCRMSTNASNLFFVGDADIRIGCRATDQEKQPVDMLMVWRRFRQVTEARPNARPVVPHRGRQNSKIAGAPAYGVEGRTQQFVAPRSCFSLVQPRIHLSDDIFLLLDRYARQGHHGPGDVFEVWRLSDLPHGLITR